LEQRPEERTFASDDCSVQLKAATPTNRSEIRELLSLVQVRKVCHQGSRMILRDHPRRFDNVRLGVFFAFIL
jgi:hypothetical protein